MFLLRLGCSTAAMAAAALLLSVAAPDAPAMVDALSSPQETVDVEGADTLLVAAAGVSAWAVWLWGALGLALTAGSVVPGPGGAAAGRLLRSLLPGGARRAAALAFGLGLAAPVLLAPPGGADRPVLAAAPTPVGVPDWPVDDRAAVPDEPAERPAGAHVVVRGDCLWTIAADRLDAVGAAPPDSEVAAAVGAWWSVNTEVIGPDPDLILPGQVLRPPQQP